MTLFPRGGGNSIVVYSTDGGDSWQLFPETGLPSSYIVTSIVGRVTTRSAEEYELHIGLFMNQSNGAGIYGFNSVIGIQPVTNEIPGEFALHQNYPNPFNPATNIEFAIPKSSFVRLAVYDMLGREIEILANENLKAGAYKTDWNASNYTSGVYFYKLTSEGFTETKRMILLK